MVSVIYSLHTEASAADVARFLPLVMRSMQHFRCRQIDRCRQSCSAGCKRVEAVNFAPHEPFVLQPRPLVLCCWFSRQSPTFRMSSIFPPPKLGFPMICRVSQTHHSQNAPCVRTMCAHACAGGDAAAAEAGSHGAAAAQASPGRASAAAPQAALAARIAPPNRLRSRWKTPFHSKTRHQE